MPSLDDLKQWSIRNFNLSIGLRVVGGGVVVLDSQLWAKIPEGVVVELFPIILDQDSRDSILADDVTPYEVSHVLLCDGDQGFVFYPFGEIIYADYKEF